MPKYLRIGKFEVETKSLICGVALAYAGLSIPQTKSFFSRIYSFISGLFNKK